MIREDEVIQERYRLQHPVGKGGMAEVWCARDERLDRPVAIKFLAPQFHGDPEFLVRFFSEAQSVAQMTHPNVVNVLDFGDHQDRPYLVMEFVSGGALTELTGAPVLPERAVEVVAEAARGAGTAHRLGMVHRDIKPANILLTDQGHAKLADFGIASSRHGEKLTATGQAIGSPHYISPEQASGVGCSPASDVYALGVVLYELLTGKPPFDADNVTAIAIAHVDKQPTPPSAVVPDLDPALEAIVMICLEKDPTARFENGNALAQALEEPDLARGLVAPVIDPDEYDELEDDKPLGRRVLTSILVTGVVVAFIGAAVWATTREAPPERPLSRDAETRDRGIQERRPKKRPSPTASSTFDTSDSMAATSVSPSPSPTRQQEKKERQQRDPGAGPGGSGGGGTQPEPEPEPSPTPEPTPEPEPTPTLEPEPEPTGQTDTGTGVEQPSP